MEFESGNSFQQTTEIVRSGFGGRKIVKCVKPLNRVGYVSVAINVPRIVTSGVFLVICPNPILHFARFFVHPLFPVFEPHIQKWVISVRRRPCVCDTFRFESPPFSGKQIDFFGAERMRNITSQKKYTLATKKSTQHGDTHSPPRGLAAHHHPPRRSEDPNDT